MTTDHESRLRQMAAGDFIIPDDLAAESIRWAIAELDALRQRCAQLQRDYDNSQEFAGQLEQRLVDLRMAKDAAYEYGVRALQERDKLQKFKDFVHNYLDAHGVPHHPAGQHGAEGCRIGDRMDWLMERLRDAESERDACHFLRDEAFRKMGFDPAGPHPGLVDGVARIVEMNQGLTERVGKMSHHLGLLAGRQPERFFSTKLPQEPGWYFWRLGGRLGVSEVVADDCKWPVETIQSMIRISRCNQSFDWAGPIPVPPGDAVQPAEVETCKVMCDNGEVVEVGIGATEGAP